MDGQPEFYRHSGRVEILGWISTTASSLLAAAILAWVYTYAVLYIPIIYLNALLAMGFGFAIGWVASKFAIHFKIRNTSAAGLAAFVAALGGCYISWAIWLSHHLSGGDYDISTMALMRKPHAMWVLIKIINATGTWSVGHSVGAARDSVNGIALWVVWIAEAVLILGASVLTVKSKLRLPYCEACDRWCQEQQGVLIIAGEKLNEAQAALIQRDWVSLGSMLDRGSESPVWGRLDVCTCLSCPHTNTVTMTQIKRTVDRKGKTSTEETVTVNQILLDEHETAALFALSKTPETETSEPPTESPESPAR